MRDLLSDHAGAVGYLLKDRVAHPAEFLDALARVAGGGTVIDPTVISAMLSRRPLDALTVRERDVLRLIAEGRSNAAICAALHLSGSATTKHITTIFDKLGLGASPEANRRVLAVLSYLDKT
jgi:DNA-binding NarL/FixJ family response regulator